MQSRRNSLVIALACLAILFVSIPIQRFIPISRFVHYGIAISIFGTGYLLQAFASWRQAKTWGRISYLVTGIFFVAIGLVFIYNPWLDCRANPQTEDQDYWRRIIQSFYFLSALIVSGVWLAQFYEERKAAAKRKSTIAHPETTE